MERVTLEIIQFLLNNDIELSSTHRILSIPIIDRIYRKMKAGLLFRGIKVAGNIICDGHHRYVASLLAGVTLDRVPSVTTSATNITDWKSVVFDEIDFDPADDIEVLNMRDAEYNHMTVDEIVEMLK